MCVHSISLSISRTFSNAAHWRVEEHTAREVGVAPLRERRLLLKVLFNGRKVLLQQRVVVRLVRCAEVLVVQLLLQLTRPLRSASSRRVFGAGHDRLGAAVGIGRAASLDCRQAAHALARRRGKRFKLWAWCLIARTHVQLLVSYFLASVVINEQTNFAVVTPLSHILLLLAFEDLADLFVLKTF